MSGNVFSFYRCTPWRKLMERLKLERVDQHGNILCEYCGKPIIKAYDCIGHHTIPLDEINVHDAMITLNPKLIQLVHHGCHNKIHHKLGYEEQKVFLVYGPPLAGKTSFVQDAAKEGDLVLDIDSIWQCVSGCKRYIKPNRLKKIAFDVRDKILDDIRVKRGRWLNAYVIGGYALISERERLVKSLGAREVFIDTSKEECIRRLQVSNDGRNKKDWEKYICDWFRQYAPRLED